MSSYKWHKHWRRSVVLLKLGCWIRYWIKWLPIIQNIRWTTLNDVEVSNRNSHSPKGQVNLRKTYRRFHPIFDAKSIEKFLYRLHEVEEILAGWGADRKSRSSWANKSGIQKSIDTRKDVFFGRCPLYHCITRFLLYMILLWKSGIILFRRCLNCSHSFHSSASGARSTEKAAGFGQHGGDGRCRTNILSARVWHMVYIRRWVGGMSLWKSGRPLNRTDCITELQSK